MNDDNPSDADPFGQIADEFVEAFRQGQGPSVEEFARRYPAHADEIRDMLPALVLMEKAKSADDAPGQQRQAQAAAAAVPLQQLGDYQILREVGRGGMGVVYEAQQLSLGRHVAIKVLPSHALLDPRQLGRFQREARSAAKLHHTNIVPVFGVGEQDGLHYYVMQFIQGLGLDVVLDELRRLRQPRGKQAPTQGDAPGRPTNVTRDVSAVAVARGLLSGEFRPPEPASDLTTAPGEERDEGRGMRDEGRQQGASASSLIPRPSSLSSSATIRLPGQTEGSTLSEAGSRYWQSVARIGVQVADALAHAVSQGVLHRDVKPSNLLLDDTGNVWVTDFGLAKAAGDGDDLTHTGDVVGTLRYMAPERFNGQGGLRSDVYSLGLTVYELLTLRPAFDETDRNKLVRQVMHDEPVRPRKLNPRVPRDLETVVLKAIARDPAHRYQTPGEMAEDLKRFVEDRPVRARRISETERLWRWCRRNPVVAGLTVALLLVFLAGFAGVAWKWQEAERQKDIAQAAERGEAAQRAAAEAEADQSRRLLYASDISLALHAWEAGTFAHARAALERHRPQAGQEDLRGFEYCYLWGLCQDASKYTLRGHTAAVSAVAFAPDGRTLATRGDDNCVRLWDMASRRHVKLLRYRGIWGQYCGSLAFAPDGKTLAIADDSARAIHLWDVAARCERTSLQQRTGFGALAFSPDGKLLATGCHDGIVRLWDIATRREVCTLQGHTLGVMYIAFAPDGKTLASGSSDSTVRLWDVARRSAITTFRGHPGMVKSLAFSPDGKTLASAGVDSSIRLWDTVRKQRLTTLRGPSVTMAVTFSPDGKRLATGASDGTVRVWDPATREVVAMLQGHSAGIVRALAYAPDGQTLVSAGEDGTVKVWDVSARRDPNILAGDKAWFRSVAFAPDGKTLAAGDGQGALRLWDMGSREQIATFPGDKGPCCVTFAPDGRTLAAGSGNTVRLWDTRTKAPLVEFQHPGSGWGSITFSPDGRLVAVGSNPTDLGGASTVLVWDRAAGREAARLPGKRVEFSPDGTLLAAGLDNTVRLHDAATWQERAAFGGHTPYVTCLAFSPDGKTLATGDWQGTLRLWDVAEKRLLASRQVEVMVLQALAFSPDGRRLVTSGGDGGVKFWDAALLRKLDQIPDPDGPDGRRARERLWAAASLGTFTGGHDGLVWSVAFSRDGNTLATGGQDVTVRLWHAPPLSAALPELAVAASQPPTETLHVTSLELFGTAQATQTIEENVYRVDVTAVDGTGWHARLSQVFDDLKEGATYTVRFRARADVPRPMHLYGQIGEADWHGFGLNEVVRLTADWQTYERQFRAKDLAASNMIQFTVGDRTGTVWIADIRVTRATK